MTRAEFRKSLKGKTVLTRVAKNIYTWSSHIEAVSIFDQVATRDDLKLETISNKNHVIIAVTEVNSNV